MTKIAKNLAQKFIDQLENLRDTKGDDITIGDIDGLFKHLRSDNRDEIYSGIEEIAEKINIIKVELSTPHAGQVSEEKLPDAHKQLEAIVAATEEATNIIMDSTERLQNHIDSLGLTAEENAPVLDEITKVFEACSFQDITGQRTTKVIKTLIDIDTSIINLLEAIHGKVEIEVKAQEDSSSDGELTDEDLMQGPQLDTPTQEEIDKLFAES